MRELKLKGKVNGQRNCMTGKREMRLSQKGKAACRLAQGSKSGSPMITVTLHVTISFFVWIRLEQFAPNAFERFGSVERGMNYPQRTGRPLFSG